MIVIHLPSGEKCGNQSLNFAIVGHAFLVLAIGIHAPDLHLFPNAWN